MSTRYTPKESKQHPGWYEIPGHSYHVAHRDGRVKNVKTGYETKGSLDDRGYRRVCVWDNDSKTKKDHKIHILICSAFHGPAPKNHEVGHDDDIRDNNVATNLRWVTRQDNMARANRSHECWMTW